MTFVIRNQKNGNFPPRLCHLIFVHEIRKYIITNRCHMRLDICDRDKKIGIFLQVYVTSLSYRFEM